MGKLRTIAVLLLFMLFPVQSYTAEALSVPALIISEVVSGNYQSYYSSGDYGADLIEIRNPGPEKVRLNNFCLSDSKKNLKKYVLPDMVLKPGAFYVIQCDDSGEKKRAGFKISSAGETVYLSDQTGHIVDQLKVPTLPIDVSYGRNDDGELRFFSRFTPGEANGAGYLRVASAPEISVPSGGYNEPFQVELSGEKPIYYTLDGSTPTARSMEYSTPVSIRETSCLRAVSIPRDAVPSTPVSTLYRFDCDQYKLPTLTVSLSESTLRKGKFGLLSHTEDRSMAVPAVVTLLKANGSVEFSRDCGLGISGQTTRGRTYRGWKLKFKSMYGGRLQDNLFPGSGEMSHDSLNLRVGSSFNPTHDVLGTAIGEDTMPAVLCQHYRPVNLFIGKSFYGVYYLRENINPFFVASRLGGSEEQVDIVYRVYETEEGSGDDWKELIRFCRTHDLSEQKNYNFVSSRLNVESLIDYYIWRAYTGDTDFPNFRAARCRDGKDTRWHLIMYDLDWAFREKNKDSVSLKTYAYTAYDSSKRNNMILTALFQNREFRDLYLDRLAMHLKETFDPERVNNLLDRILDEVMPDMPATWDIRKASARKWKEDAKEIRSFIGNGKTDRRLLLVKETKEYFRLSDEETKELFGNLFN